MITVKFDNTAISADYIYELTRTHELFEGSFKLGSVSAQTYKLTVDKEGVVNKMPSFVYIIDGSTNVATLLVDSLDEDDKLIYKYDLIDSMVKLEFYYDASQVIGGSSATLLQILQDICTKAGLTLASNSTTFNGYNMNVTWYDNTITAREYVSYIAELNGGFAFINEDGELELKRYSSTAVDTVDINDCENFVLGEQYSITRVVYDDASGSFWEYGTNTGATLYLNINNPYINDASTVESIYNLINGFSFYCVSTDNAPTVDGEIGDVFEYVDGSTSYPTILQIDQTYGGDIWYGGYSLDIDSPQQEETKLIDNTSVVVKSIKTTVDRELGSFTRRIEAIESKNESQDVRFSQIEQNYDGLVSTVGTVQTNLDSSVQALSTAIQQTATDLGVTISDVRTTVDEQGEHIETLETYIKATSRGLEVGKNTDDIVAVYGSNEMAFYDRNDTKLAWLSSEEGLGASALSVGDATTRANRWRIITRQGGSHLTFTRHN